MSPFVLMICLPLCEFLLVLMMGLISTSHPRLCCTWFVQSEQEKVDITSRLGKTSFCRHFYCYVIVCHWPIWLRVYSMKWNKFFTSIHNSLWQAVLTPRKDLEHFQRVCTLLQTWLVRKIDPTTYYRLTVKHCLLWFCQRKNHLRSTLH